LVEQKSQRMRSVEEAVHDSGRGMQNVTALYAI